MSLIFQKNEYAPLKKVIVAPPDFMEIKEVINHTQRVYKKQNIAVNRALEQHQNFVQSLKDRGIKVIELTPVPELNELVFTRDIGFTIDDTLFTANMRREIREKETELLHDVLEKNNVPYHPITTCSIEGGDVLVDEDKVWVGNSERTTTDAIDQLRSYVEDKEVISLPLRKDILHLDCAFNIVSNDVALIFKDAFQKKDVERLSSHYDLIEVTDEEQFNLATNVLSIGDGNIISMPINSRVNRELEQKGFHIIEVEFTEIIKSGGSFRCCSLPVERKK